MKFVLDEFIKDRDNALLSFERPVIEAYMRKYHMDIPESDGAFWADSCRAIIMLSGMPDWAKEKAREILKEYGLSENVRRDLAYQDLW